jgi:hypothetical protein
MAKKPKKPSKIQVKDLDTKKNPKGGDIKGESPRLLRSTTFAD